MAHLIWSERRCKLGICADVKVEKRDGKIFLSGTGSGFGCTASYSREIAGNLDWSGIIGNCNGAVHLHIRIENWKRTASTLSFDLRLWGAYGNGPWLPPGGEHFRVFGRLNEFASNEEFGKYMINELEGDLQAHGVLNGETQEAPEPLSA